MDEGSATHLNGDENSNASNADGGETIRRPKPKWRNAVENLSGIWFTIVMNTGVLGILYNTQPYSFSGLKVISTIMYVLTIVLFTILLIPTIIRWTVFHKTTVKKTHNSLDDIAMLGAIPIAWFEIVALTALITSNASWGHSFTIVAYVMWWIGMVWMVTTCCGVCFYIFLRDVTKPKAMSPSLFIPAVGVATGAVAGSIVCNYSYDLSPGLAVPVLIMCYFMNGLAIFISMELYTLYFHCMMVSGLPAGPKLPSLLILIGPFGQTAAALLLAGEAASSRGDFNNYMRGTFLNTESALSVSSSGTLLALLLLGHDFFWLVISFAGVIKGFIYREHTYTLVWWSAVFPIATTTTAFVELSTSMDSPTFRVLAAIFTISLTIIYLINWVFTIWYIFKGDLLIKSDDDEIVDGKDD